MDQLSKRENCVKISAENITKIIDDIGYENFGYIAKLMAHEVQYQKNLSDEKMHIYLNVSRRKWLNIAKIIRPYYQRQDNIWFSFLTRDLKNQQTQETQWSDKAHDMKSITKSSAPPFKGSLPLIMGSKKNESHNTLIAQLYEVGTRLLTKDNLRSVKEARAIIAKITRQNANKLDFVFGAFVSAERQKDGLTDVLPWILGYIKKQNKNNSEPSKKQTADNYSRDGFRLIEATPQNMGISEGRMEHVRRAKEIANKKLFEPI